MSKNDIKASAKINAIRSAARLSLGMGDATCCPTCTRSAASPYRRQVDGKVSEGCIDAFHTPAFEGIATTSAAWHFRPEAVALRAQTLAHLLAL
jgi:hypothetical protein